MFSGLLITFHGAIQDALLPQLDSPRLAVRKRSIIAIGMSFCFNNVQLDDVHAFISFKMNC